MKYKLLLGVLLFIGCNRKDFLNPNDPINFPLAPILIYPTGDMLVYDNPPRLYWVLLDTSFSAVYEVQGAENSNFNNPIFSLVISSDGDTVCSYMPKGLIREHCFWRVRAKADGASDNAWGEWSPAGSFYERFPLVAEYEDIPGGNEIIIRDNYAYIIDNPGTFHILDVSDPAEPEFVESFTDSAVYRFYDIEKKGNYLYLTCYDYHSPYSYSLRIYSNPSSPQFAGACSLRSPNYLAVSYPAVYIEQRSDVAIVDVSDPANPFVADSIEVNYSIRGLAVKENHLILFTSSQIKVYDITDPFHPSITNSYSHYTQEFCISGDTLFVVDYDYAYNVTIFDISALPSIKKVSSFSSDYSFSDICFSSNCLAGRYSSSKICIFELSGAKKPEEGRLYPSHYTYDISANKGYLYSISRYGGIQVVKLCEEKY